MPAKRPAPWLIAVSLKMYFSHARTVEWCRAVVDMASMHPAVVAGDAELVVLPTFTSIPAALDLLSGHAEVGAQDLSEHDRGAFTGEVSGAELAELGVGWVEIGHAERRRLFGETDDVVRAKTRAALRNGLTPLLCVGETLRGDAAAAVAECARLMDVALEGTSPVAAGARVVIAYEPFWAIGASEPASNQHIRSVCTALRDHARQMWPSARPRVIYGGSAGPSLLDGIADGVDGLFLGRFAHDPDALRRVLDDVCVLSVRG